AESPEDPFRQICLETLTEIRELPVNDRQPIVHESSLVVKDIDLMAKTVGIRTLLHVLSEGITDAYGRGPECAERMKACTRIIVSMLRTWSVYRKLNQSADIAKPPEHPQKHPALTGMLEESPVGSNLSRKATLLMGELLQMANRVLPLTIAASIQALPRVFTLASDYSVGEHRIVGTSAVSSIDSFNRHRASLQPITANAKGDSRPRSNSIEDAVRRGQRQMEQAKIKMAIQMEDKAFQALLLETQ
ncbi:uncharacterized protein LAESUDRAFT_718693, partial [Laetiporus sulphureus 93-53]